MMKAGILGFYKVLLPRHAYLRIKGEWFYGKAFEAEGFVASNGPGG